MSTPQPQFTSTDSSDSFVIAGKVYQSRLLVGSGKYKDLEETRLATEASGAEIITVAIRRTNIGQNPDEPNCWMWFRQINIPTYLIQPVVIPLMKQCVPVV